MGKYRSIRDGNDGDRSGTEVLRAARLCRMTVFAAQYTYTEDTAARDQHRPAHRTYLGGLADDGTLVASGPYGEDGQFAGALLLLRAGSAEEVHTLLRDDPFMEQGLVESLQVREWTLVLGAELEAVRGSV